MTCYIFLVSTSTAFCRCCNLRYLTQVRHFVAASITLKGLGGLLFVFGSSMGAYLLVSFPALNMTYSVSNFVRWWVRTCEAVKGTDSYYFPDLCTLFWLSLCFAQMYHLLYTTPLFYDFYNYRRDEPEFSSNLQECLQVYLHYNLIVSCILFCSASELWLNMMYIPRQCVALFGALLYFLGMKNSLSRRLKKKTPKAKTA